MKRELKKQTCSDKLTLKEKGNLLLLFSFLCYNCVGENMSINKIVFTGAPCSGKTEILRKLEKYYKDKTDCVFVCEEAASEVKKSGTEFLDIYDFQRAVYEKQIENENKIEEQIKDLADKNVLVFYDRGVCDGYSYVDDENRFFNIIGESRYSSFFRYDTALLFEICYENDYNKSNVRTEDYADALKLQDKIISCYVGHPHLRYIKSAQSFDEKIKRVIEEIDFILQEKEIEKKYLIKYPSYDDLMSYNPFICDISQTYLLSNLGSHRVRERRYKNESIYYETLKVRITPSECYESERIITKEEYYELLESADPNKNTINKKRCCFLYKDKYFELDLFDFWDDKAFLEVELKNINEAFNLPERIKIIKDVSDDEHYKNNYLAGMKL